VRLKGEKLANGAAYDRRESFINETYLSEAMRRVESGDLTTFG